MGDKDFEKFLGDDQNQEGFNQVCHRRLFLEALQTKMEFLSRMYSSTVEACIEMKKQDPQAYEKMLSTLYRLSGKSKDTLEQMDFFLSTVIEEMEGENGNKS